MDWNPYFTTMAAATATVMGLLFIAVQLSNDKLKEDDKRPIRALALSTFYILMVVFLVSVFFLIPALGPTQQALVVFLAAGFGLLRIFSNWLPVMRNPYFGQRERAWQTVWHFIGPMLAYFYLVYIGIQILSGGQPQGTDFEVAIVLIFLFSNGIRNSWNLVVEMAFDRKK
jgi:hypothetical protein